MYKKLTAELGATQKSKTVSLAKFSVQFSGFYGWDGSKYGGLWLNNILQRFLTDWTPPVPPTHKIIEKSGITFTGKEE